MEERSKELVLDDRELYEGIFSPVCAYCAHWLAGLGRRCLAFERIPDDIWSGTVDHRSPYPGDGGIQFEFHSEVSESEKARLQERETLQGDLYSPEPRV